MYNKDSIFYYDFFDAENRKFRITIIKGDVNNIVTPVLVKLPNNFIREEEVVIEAGFDNDMPYGMQLANTLKLNINLTSLNIDSNFSDLKSWLLNANSFNIDGTYKTIYTQEIPVPNRFTVCELNTNNTVKRIIFDGFQEFKGTNTVKYKSKERNTYFELEITGVEKLILTSIPMDFAKNPDLLVSLENNNSSIVYNRLNQTYANIFNNYENSNSDIHYFKPFNTSEIIYSFSIVYTYLTRNYIFLQSNHTIKTDNPLITYKQGYTNSLIRGVETEPSFVVKIENSSNVIIGGNYNPLSENGICAKYINAWDYLKTYCDTFFFKITFDYTIYSITEIFKLYVYNSTLLNNNTLHSTHPNYIDFNIINLSDIKENDIDVELGYNLISESTRNVIDTGSKGVTKITTRLNGSLNDFSDDGETLLHSNIPLNNDYRVFPNTIPNIVYRQERLRIRNLYYYDTTYNKWTAVHPSIRIDLGEGEYIENTNSPIYSDLVGTGEDNEITYSDVEVYNVDYNTIHNEKNNISASARIANDIILKIFGKTLQKSIGFDIDSSKIDISQLGRIYELYLGSTIGINTTAYLTSVSYNIKESISTCKFFVRG